MTAASARSGQEGGNGGDSVAQDFAAYGYKAFLNLSKVTDGNDDIRQKLGDAQQLLQRIGKVQVLAKDTVTLPGPDGRPLVRDAVNTPKSNPPTIVVNRARWLAETMNETAKTRLALHEYLGILGLEQNTYEVSEQIIARLEAPKIVATPATIRSTLDCRASCGSSRNPAAFFECKFFVGSLQEMRVVDSISASTRVTACASRYCAALTDDNQRVS